MLTCPHHDVPLVERSEDGRGRNLRLACSVSDCQIYLPKAGCPRCGEHLEPTSMVRVGSGTVDTAAWRSGVRLRCAEHGDWQWHEPENILWNDDRTRRIRFQEPGRLGIQDGDLLVKPETATGPEGAATFWVIKEWPGASQRLRDAWPNRSEVVEDAKRMAGRKGVQVWADEEPEHDKHLIQPRPIW